MKKFLPVLFLLFGVLVFSETLKKEVNVKYSDLSSVNSVSFEFVNGKAEIKGDNVKSIVIKGFLTVRGKDQSICEDVLKNANIEIKKHGDELEISLNYDELKDKLGNNNSFFGFFCSWRKRVEIQVDLSIIVPSSLSIQFSGVNFDLAISDVKDAEVSNVNGNARIINADKVKCESVNGNVYIKDVKIKAGCEVVNGNFNIETNSNKLSSISFESVNGNAEIKLPLKVIGNISTESLTSKTVLNIKGKKIVKKNLEWKGDGNCDIDIETINGRIVIDTF